MDEDGAALFVVAAAAAVVVVVVVVKLDVCLVVSITMHRFRLFFIIEVMHLFILFGCSWILKCLLSNQ